MKHNPFKKFCWALVTLMLFATILRGQQWHEFRGPNGSGHSACRNMPRQWGDDSKNIRWSQELPGLGWSSPVVHDGRICVTAADETTNRLMVLILDLETGKVLHNTTVFEKKLGRIHKKNSHASPTAVVDGDRLYVHFGDYGTAGLDWQGKVLWKRVFKYGHFHGPGGSPLVWRDRVFLSCDGGDQQFLVALQKDTGETIWRVEKKHIHPDRFKGGKMKPIAFSTPSIRKTGNGEELVVCGADHIAGFDPESGKELWWAGYDGYSIVPRPVFHGDMVFYSSCYNRPVLYGLKIDGTGDITDKIVWQTSKGAPHNPTPLVVGDLLLVVSDRGIGQCLDVNSGKVHWQKRLGRAYSASPILVDGMVLFQDETGGTILIRPSSTYEEIGRNSVSGRTLATPVPVPGGLLIRTDTRLIRFDGPSK